MRILGLLGESIRHSRDLKDLLEGECSALKAQDAETLQTLARDKRDCVDALKVLDQKRAALCTEAGFPNGPAQMDQMCDWCDEDGVIRKSWTTLLEIATACRALNDTIGAVIHTRRNQVATGLTVLRGGEARQGTYGRNAVEEFGAGSRNLAKA